MAVILSQSVQAEDVLDRLSKAQPSVLESVTIFDMYQGKAIPKGKKSLGLRFRYRAQDRTLTEDEEDPFPCPCPVSALAPEASSESVRYAVNHLILQNKPTARVFVPCGK
ncbi:MAG: hypothetical protein K6360_06440 [Deltaproteobacteria bacterium]